MMIEEARDPKTSLARLTEILDVCDQPRRDYAARARSITASGERTRSPDDWEEAQKRRDQISAARVDLESALARDEFKDLAMAVASNPNLDREQWVRALELAPQAAVRNPLMQLMIVGGTPIIQHGYEVVALGILGACATRTPPDSIEREALVDIICMGLELASPEPCGVYRGQTRYDVNQRAAHANRYWWEACNKHDRADALHSAGRVIIDVLQCAPQARSAMALGECHAFGELLSEMDEDSRHCERFGVIPFAPRGQSEFVHDLWVIFNNGQRSGWGEWGEPILGWSEPAGSVVWLREEGRPGFIRGRVRRPDEAMPQVIQAAFCHDSESPVWSCSHSTSGATEYDGEPLFIDLSSSGAIESIAEGHNAQFGVTELTDCILGQPFPAAEIGRLSKLFGAESAVVRFAKGSSTHGGTCPECDNGPFIRCPGFCCDSCGLEYEEDDNDETE